MNRRSASELARIGRREQITEAAHGLDHVDAELLADAADEHLDGIEVAVEILVVEMLDQFGARHHAAGVMHQIGQQPVLVRGELDRIAVDGDAAGAGVEADRAAGEFALGVAGGAAQQRAHPRQHFLEVKGLGNIIVGTGVKTLHLVAPAIARGKDQNRHGATGAPPGFQYRNAVHLRQTDVEDDGVIGLALAEIVTFLAVEGAVDNIAGIGQRGSELPIEIGIVLDNEKPQTAPPIAKSASSIARRPACL